MSLLYFPFTKMNQILFLFIIFTLYTNSVLESFFAGWSQSSSPQTWVWTGAMLWVRSVRSSSPPSLSRSLSIRTIPRNPLSSPVTVSCLTAYNWSDCKQFATIVCCLKYLSHQNTTQLILGQVPPIIKNFKKLLSSQLRFFLRQVHKLEVNYQLWGW